MDEFTARGHPIPFIIEMWKMRLPIMFELRKKELILSEFAVSSYTPNASATKRRFQNGQILRSISKI